jgi:hypothetical protein
LQRKGIPVEKTLADAAISADGDAAVEIIQTIYSFLHSPNYE